MLALARAVRQDRKRTGIQNQKWISTSIVTDDKILYRENPKLLKTVWADKQIQQRCKFQD